MENSGDLSQQPKSLINQPWLIAAVLFLLSFGLRLTALGRYITPDELIWVYRSVLFREALAVAQWSDTLVAGHPGVTTTWLGALGISIQLLLQTSSQDVYTWITKLAYLTPDNMAAFQALSTFLTAGRILTALVNSIGIVVIAVIVGKLLGRWEGWIVGLLLAIDPFILGLSGILHVDGLATTFITISILTLILALQDAKLEKGPWQTYLLAATSGSMVGLAVLSKSPALVLIPLVLLIFLWTLFSNRSVRFQNYRKRLFLQAILWVAGFAIITFLLFPALWVSPMQVFLMSSGNAGRHMAEALRPTFFMGNVAFNHGLLFYPVALLWRISPVVFVGLLFLPVFIIRRRPFGNSSWKMISIFTLWTFFFIVVISLAAKKFDRYTLPVFPSLTILAVIAWSIGTRFSRRFAWLFGGLFALQLVYLAFVILYPLSAYNPLLGGPFTAARLLPIGWGESISGSGRWLQSRQDVEQQTAVSGIAPSLAPFFPGETLLEENEGVDAADYVIYTANSRQDDPQGVETATRDFKLLQTIHYGLIDQAWIYENPYPLREERSPLPMLDPVSFGGQMDLIGQQLMTTENIIHFTAKWHRQNPEARMKVKLKLLGQYGDVWRELETELLNEVYFYPESWAENEEPIVTYILEAPPAMPPGQYHVVLSVIDELSGGQLPVIATNGSFLGVEYNLGEIENPVQRVKIDFEALDLQAVEGQNWEGLDLKLLGYNAHPNPIIAGANLAVDMAWEAGANLPPALKIGVQVGDDDPIIFPISRFDSGNWPPGMVVREKYQIPIKGSTPGGSYPLKVWVLQSEDGQITNEAITLGLLEVQTSDRIFDTPQDISIPMTVHFEPEISLLGIKPGVSAVKPGERITFTLYWQSGGQTAAPVTAFIHIMDQNGNIITQSDRWPGGLPSDTWLDGQVIIDEFEIMMPMDAVTGNYLIGLGLYNAADGQRFAAYDENGQAFDDNLVVLPLQVTVP